MGSIKEDFSPRRRYPVQSPSESLSEYEAAKAYTAANKPHKLPVDISAVEDSQHPAHTSGRTLVVCLDGTGDQFDHDNSNVVHFVGTLKKDDPNQVVYYQSGIGTYGDSGLTGGFSAAMDMAVGASLGLHVREAYEFLMQNYNEDDRICIFGFSRGAYTARCLAGMLNKVGLLPAHNQAQIYFAYNFYKDDSELGWKMSKGYKKTFCIDVNVYYLGLWDCVSSVGIIPRRLPFTKTSSNKISYYRHAMALDEHRAKFKICRWVRQDSTQAMSKPSSKLRSIRNHLRSSHRSEQAKDLELTERKKTSRQLSTASAASTTTGISLRNSSQNRDMSASHHLNPFRDDEDAIDAEVDYEAEVRSEDSERPPADVLEVWFAGAHADIGGGAVRNETRHVLARIPLRWMIRETFRCNTGIIYKRDPLAELGLDVPSLWPQVQKRHRPAVGPSPAVLELSKQRELPALTRRPFALKHFTKHGNLDYPTSAGEADLLPEQIEDYFDAMAPMNDQLVQALGWWLGELWPVKIRVQCITSDDWTKRLTMNLGRYRAVQDVEPIMHWTVKHRMEEMDYKLKNRCHRRAVWRICV
jgi:uncharacterized protein (DUF2235 family)